MTQTRTACSELEPLRRQWGPIEARAIAADCGDDLGVIADRLRFQLEQHGDLLPLADRLAVRIVAATAAALGPVLRAVEQRSGRA